MLRPIRFLLVALWVALSAPLLAQDFTPVGKLALNSKLKGTLYVDGKKEKPITENKTLLMEGIPVGQHVLEVVGTGGVLVYRSVATVSQGKTTTFDLVEDPTLASQTYYTGDKSFTQDYRNPFEKLKKEETARIAELRRQLEAQQFEAVSKTLQAWLAEDASNPIPNYFVGMLRIREAEETDEPAVSQKLLAAAATHFEFGLKKARPFAYSYAGMAHCLALKKELGAAFEHAYLAEALDGNDPALLEAIADAYMASKSYSGLDNAGRILTKASAISPDNANVLVATGDVYFVQGIEEIPLNYYQQAIAKDPANVRAYYRLGRYYIAQKAYSEGNVALEKCVSLDPSFAPAYIELGELYYRINDFGKAKGYYKQYVDLRGNDLRARYRYTQFLYLSKDYQTAVTEIQTVLKDTTTSVLLRLLAYSATESGNVALARESFEKYVQSWQPNELIAKDYEYRGKIKLAEGDLDGGAADLQRCFELDGSRSDLIQYLVNFFGREKKDYTRAAQYQAVLTEADGSLTNYVMLGSLHKASKNKEAAMAAYTKTTELYPDFIGAWYELANLQWETDRADPDNPQFEAKPYFDKVIELGEADVQKNQKQLLTAYFYQAYFAYLSEKDGEKAIGFCDKCLALDPTYSTASSLKEQIEKDLGR